MPPSQLGVKSALRAPRRLAARVLDRFAWFDSWKLKRVAARRRSFVEQFLAPIGGVGAELGVFKGHFTAELMQTANPTLLYAVDPWHLLSPTWPWAAGRKSTVDGLADVYRRNRVHVESGQLRVHVADDLVFLAALPDEALDWAYVDSSHWYEHTVDELSLLKTKVRPGGLITGDDWHDDSSHRHGGVGRAVREFVASHHAELLYSDDTTMQWAVRLPAP